EGGPRAARREEGAARPFRARRNGEKLGPLLQALHAARAPLPKFVIRCSTPMTRTSEAKGHEQVYASRAAYDLKFLDKLAAGGAGTSNRRHWPKRSGAQTLAPARPPGGYHLAPALGRHARAEAV